MTRAAQALLSTENLLHNIAIIQKHAPRAQIMAMVKANAYGHGLRSVALRIQHIIDSFGVASIDEAQALRRVGITRPITLLEGIFEPDELIIAAQEDFNLVFHNTTQVQWLNTRTVDTPLTAWLKIDTGLGRLGFAPHETHQAYQLLSASPSIRQPIGIISHFACADTKEHPLNNQQISVFQRYINNIPGPKSLCNSAGIFSFPEHQYDVVRPGIALYGISPVIGISAQQLGLKPVMTLTTRLITVRTAQKGSSLGYGARYTCPETMPIGVIAMGYGDGLPRTAHDGMPILVNGVRCHLVGRVSMDMATIDLRNYPHARVGDSVTLWGEGLPIEDIAPYTENIPYDIITSVQNRVRFHWTS